MWGNEKAWLLRESEVFHFKTSSSAARPCHLSCRDPWRGRRIDRHNGRDSETPTRQRASRLSEPSENDSEKAPPYLKRSRKNTACVRERPTSRTTRQWALARDCVGRGPCGYGYREVHKKNNVRTTNRTSHRVTPNQTRTRETLQTSHSICYYASSSPCTIIKRTSATGESPAPPKLTRARSASGFAGCARARDSSGRLAAAGVGVF